MAVDIESLGIDRLSVRERLDQIYEGEAGFFPPDGRSEVALPALST